MGQVPALVIDGHTLADSVSSWFYFVTLLLIQTINGIYRVKQQYSTCTVYANVPEC